jgi:vancomycin resistance protein VanJ
MVVLKRPVVPIGERIGQSASNASRGAGRASGRFADSVIRSIRRASWRDSLPWAPLSAISRPGWIKLSPRAYVRTLRTLAWTTWVYAAAALIATILLWTLSDRWFVASAILFGPRWLFLLPLALLVPIAAFVRRPLLLPLAGTALIVLFPLMGLRVNGATLLPGGSAKPDLRIVTFNAAGGDYPGMILGEVLEEWDADIIAFQECGPSLEGAIRLQKGWYSHDDQQQLCLLSRWPITEALQIDRKAFERVREFGLGGSSDAVRYTIASPKRPIVFTNVHLETPRKGINAAMEYENEQALEDNTSLRELESRRARDWANKGRGPMLVAGDFNMPIESAIYRESWGDLENAFSAVGNGFGMTKDNGWIKARIDHVLSGPGWRPKRVRIGRFLDSDHWPVIVDLQWVGGR